MSNADGVVVFTQDGSVTSSEQSSLQKLWDGARTKNKPGEGRVFYNVDCKGKVAAVQSLGKLPANASENLKAERTRKAAALGALALRSSGASSIAVAPGLSPHAAATGANLALFKYSLKSKKDESVPEKVDVSPLEQTKAESGGLGWESGEVYARAQNLARELMEAPANFVTPTAFTERAKKELEGLKNVEIHVRDEAWAKEKKMNSFLSVAAGTDEPAKILEIYYKGAADPNAQPLALVGKGITFDSGGISLKPGAGMKLMRGDMGGAATLFASTWAIAKLQLPINVVFVAALTENMPSGKATKPGDIITAMNGKTIEVDNTDAEGRLVLADALWYASSTFNPHTVIDAATLTGAIVIALGEVYSAVFSSDDKLWEDLKTAGEAEADEFWRMPLNSVYLKQIDGTAADLCNTGGRPAGSCTAAIFLREMVEGLDLENDGANAKRTWAHVDIAGSMECTRPEGYNTKGMSGRPTRSIIEYARRLGLRAQK